MLQLNNVSAGPIQILFQNLVKIDWSPVTTFSSKYGVVLFATVVLQFVAYRIWDTVALRFLMPEWPLLAGMALLEIAIISAYYGLTTKCWRVLLRLIFMGAVCLLIGLCFKEYWSIAHPEPLPADIYGIAVAQFGEGPDYRITDNAREVTQSVLNSLAQQLKDKGLTTVQYRPLGLIKTPDEAVDDSLRIGADLIIWGTLKISESKTVVNFYIQQTPDKIFNPNFPRIMSLSGTKANDSFDIPGHDSDAISHNTAAIAAFAVGLGYFDAWDFDQAAQAFQKSTGFTFTQSASQPSSYLYLAYLYYGLSLQGKGEVELANAQFEASEKIRTANANTSFGNDPAAALAWAWGARSLGQISDAQREAKTAHDLCTAQIKLQPTAEAYYDRALANQILAFVANPSSPDWSLALNDFKMALSVSPNLFVARIGVIQMQLALKDGKHALESAQQALQKTQDARANPAWAYLYLAKAWELVGNDDEARNAYQAASSHGKQIDWIHQQVGEFYARIHDPDALKAARQEYQAMLDVSDDQVGAHTIFANFLSDDQNMKILSPDEGQTWLEDAVTEYNAALRTNPDVSSTWARLAEVLARLTKFEDASRAYESGVRAEGRTRPNWYLHVSYGYFLYFEHQPPDPDSAIKEWKLTIRINPKNCDAHLYLALAYRDRQDFEQARQEYGGITADEAFDQECRSKAQQGLDALGHE